jgi:hypothetical protein
MKTHYRTATTASILIIVVLSSCSSTNLLTVSVTEPSIVFIPLNITTVGIIDRSLPSKENESTDKIDKILSAEGKDLDKNAAHEAVQGLNDELLKSNRFSEVKIIDGVNVRSPGSGVFPAALSWETVEQICNENNVDALFVLSFYDTDTKIAYNAVPVEIAGPMGIKIPAIEHHANVTTLIKSGWRIYDPINKSIHDEYLENKTVRSNGVGINPAKAIESITGRNEAVLQVSNNMGHAYALRILPYRIRVTRHYYVKGTDNFVVGKRRAQTGNWDGAAELWEKEVSNSKSKIAGRACYNMGIINEINGDLDAAVEWTSKSYTDYGNKFALDYVNILKYRIQKNIQLQQETSNE